MTEKTSLTDADPTPVETALERLIEATQTTTGDPTGTYTVPIRGPDKSSYAVTITAKSLDDESGYTTDRVSYCLDCEWSVSTDDYPYTEVNSRLVTHVLETGHDIESADKAEAPRTDST